MPFLFKFLCVLQSLILNPGGSPPPGANECLIKIILFPSWTIFQAWSDAFNCRQAEKFVVEYHFNGDYKMYQDYMTYELQRDWSE